MHNIFFVCLVSMILAGKTTTQTCDNEPKRTVMCETKFT